MDKKEFNEINDSLKRIILMGRSANVHLLIHYKEQNICNWWIIRDNFAIRIGMKNLSVENFKMVFGVSKDESILEREKVKVIFIDGKMEQYESPWVVLLETIKKMWSELSVVCYRYRINNADRRTRNVRNWKIMCNDNETMRGLTTKENETSHIVFLVECWKACRIFNTRQNGNK